MTCPQSVNVCEKTLFYFRLLQPTDFTIVMFSANTLNVVLLLSMTTLQRRESQ